MLTSTDETDLLVPLHDITLDTQRFTALLDRLRQRVRAARAGLLIRLAPGGDEQYWAGLDLVRQARSRGFPPATITARLPVDRMRPGRVYSAGEFLDGDEALRANYQAHLGMIGITDERIVRVAVGDDVQGWLSLSRGEPCPSSDSAILSALVPHLAVALRCHAAQHQQRIAAGLAETGLERAATGTIGFDGEGRVLSATSAAADWLVRTTGQRVRIGQRLTGLRPDVQRGIVTTAARFARDPSGAEEALCLHLDPRLDAVLVGGSSAGASVAMVALCRFPPPHSDGRAEALARLHEIPRREAELALLVSEGRTIAEAAGEMGLTVETARNYSKQLYARLGVRGQAELTTLVCTGGAMLG